MAYPFARADAVSLEALRRRLQAGLRSRVVADSEGNLSHMVWIPQFVVPAGLFNASGHSWPTADLELGGFYIDAYQCSHADATATDAGAAGVAVSVPGVVPWAGATRDEAATACAERVVGGVPCSLPSLVEWAAVVCIGRLLGIGPRGNVGLGGRDDQDPDEWPYRGVPDPTNGHDGVCLTGTGPGTWSITGDAAGPFDVLGNLSEWQDETAPGHRLAYLLYARIDDAGGIASTDLQVTLDSVESPELWPAAGGILQVEDSGNPGTYELIRYATFSDNGNGTYTLGGLTRGHRGTTAVNHADDKTIALRSEHCIAPNAVSVFVTGVNNTTDPVTCTVHDLQGGHGKAGIAVDDVLHVEAEQMLVTGVSGDAVTVSRGYAGTTITGHADWTDACTHPVGLTKAGVASGPVFLGWFRTFDSRAAIATGLLPGVVSAYPPASDDEAGDQFVLQFGGGGLGGGIVRGGHAGVGASARHGWYLQTVATAATFDWIGFRAVLRVR